MARGGIAQVLRLYLGAVILAAGFAVYFLPLTFADERPIVARLPLDPQIVDLVGEGELDQRLQFNASLVPQAQDDRFDLSPAVAFSVEAVGTNATSLRLIANATLEGAGVTILQLDLLGFNNTTIGRTHQGQAFPVLCPCPSERILFQFDLYAPPGPTHAYRYRFTLQNATLEIRPADHDGDRIVDTAQWIRGVPQYYLGFPLTVVGGVLLARAFARSS